MAVLVLGAAGASLTLMPRTPALVLIAVTALWMVLVTFGGMLHLGLVRTPDDRPREVFGLANGITLARIASVPLMAFWITFLAPGQPIAVCCFVLLLAITISDILDGNIARHLDAPTRFGRRADQAADLVVGTVAATALLAEGLLPWWFAGAVLFRYFGAGLGAALISLRKGQPTPAAPTVLGKACTLALALGVLAVVARVAWPQVLPHGLFMPLLGAGTALSLVSAADLMKRAYGWYTSSDSGT
jgi:phosphatidylglycerophosphate synthase